MELSKSGLSMQKGVKLVVWPEYALNYDYETSGSVVTTLGDFVRTNSVHLLFGGQDRFGDKPNEFYNTAFLLLPDGSIGGKQVKAQPIQFFADGEPAEKQEPLVLAEHKVGVAICYDMGYPDVSRVLVERGAEFLVFPTMDALHWGELQHEQHAAMTSIRAVETGRTVFRVATSGISQLVYPNGMVERKAETGEVASFYASIPLKREKNIYIKGGYLFK